MSALSESGPLQMEGLTDVARRNWGFDQDPLDVGLAELDSELEKIARSY